MSSLLILRAEPGAARTARRAADCGFETVVAPIFEVRSVAWTLPDLSGIDAVMLTSGHAARLGGQSLHSLTGLRCYAVGESTAEDARGAGFTDVCCGPADAAALLAMMASEGVCHALHLAGREHKALEPPGFRLSRRVVYAAEPISALPAAAAAALRAGALALLHSPRAATHFARLCEEAGLSRRQLSIAAISESAAEAAGEGWLRKAAASQPRDPALLELAAKLCNSGGSEGSE